ncbi:glutathione peroxidase [Hydrogenophaga flava]|uniref:glutathione peroxidase n=1 Tax=Hydrogenophaga flava TaxID=65657 RepID=UPI0009FCA260|nr:glutathione peroxidase [Hydrogenophaga flava]
MQSNRRPNRRDFQLGLGAALLAPLWPAAHAQTARSAACPPLLAHRFARLQDEAPQDLCQYTGKVLLVVNTASYCGFTRQYEGLEALHAKYAARGLVVMGFPSNDFGQQEPGDAKQIAELCFNTYGVKFPMFAKTVVKGAGRNAFYEQLAKATGATPQWNFHKYLVARDAKTVRSFASEVEPGSAPLTQAIEAALKAG